MEQIVLGLPVADLIRKVGVPGQVFYRCKKQHSELEGGQSRKLKQVPEESARLKRLMVIRIIFERRELDLADAESRP